MKKLLVAIVISCWATFASAQTSPNLRAGQVLTPAQWNKLFADKQDTLGFTPLSTAGGIITGRLVTSAPSATLAGFNMTPGSTPSTPANGDMWITSAGLFVQVNGSTVGPLISAASPCAVCALINATNTFTAYQAINLNAAAAPTIQSGTLLQLVGADGISPRIEINAYAGAVRFTGIRSNGTKAAPTTLIVDNEINTLNAFGYDSVGIVGPAASMRMFSGGTWSGTSHPTYMDFATTPVSSTTMTSRMRIETDGSITLNGAVSLASAGSISSANTQNNPTAWQIVNASTATGALALIQMYNSVSNASFGMAGLNYTGIGGVAANKAFVFSNTGSAGILLYTTGTNPIDFYINGSRGGGFTSAGLFTLNTPLSSANGGTSCAVASGTCLDNITGFASTGYMQRTGAGTYTFSASAPASSVTVGTTTVGGGTTTRVLFNNAGVLGEYTITGSGNVVMSASPTFTGTILAGGASFGNPVTVSTGFATALAVTRTGNLSDSAFVVDSSPASSVAGLKITGAVTGGTVAIVAIDTGSNTNLSINAKGTGAIAIGSVSTGAVTITPNVTHSGTTTMSGAITYGGVTLSNSVTGTGNMVLSASPTFTGTLTAATVAATTNNGFTLAGTIAGGGNQINNVVIGTTTPLAGSFTTVDASTSITSPIHKSAAAIDFQTNGTTYAGHITTGQQWYIGTTKQAPPTGPLLTLSKNAAALPASPLGTPQVGLTIGGADATNADLNIMSFGAGVASAVRYFNNRGTAASPTATGSGDILGVNVAYGYYTSGGPAFAAGAGFVMQATEAWTSTNRGVRLDLYAIAVGSSSSLPGASVGGGFMVGSAAADPGPSNARIAGFIATNAPVTYTAATPTLAATDADVIFNGSATQTVTLPSGSSNTGRILLVKNIAAQTVNSATSNVIPLNGGAAGTALLANTIGKWALLKFNGTNWEIMASN